VVIYNIWFDRFRQT